MPFGADTPTSEFVGNSRVRGARSPPGTPRDFDPPPGHTSARRLGTQTRPATSPEQSGEVCRPPDFFTAKRRSAARPDFTRAKSKSPVSGWTFPEQSGEVCHPPDFRRAKSESVPGGGSGRRISVPARAAKTARPAKKPGFFPAPTRMYKEVRPPFSQKKNR